MRVPSAGGTERIPSFASTTKLSEPDRDWARPPYKDICLRNRIIEQIKSVSGYEYRTRFYCHKSDRQLN